MNETKTRIFERNLLSEQYTNGRWVTLNRTRLFSHFSKELNVRTHILDLGCGEGKYSTLIVKSASDNCLVVGVDVFKQYIKKAKLNNRDARVEFLVADGQHIPFRSKSFDFVICKDILHHIRHPSEALREISRVSLGEIVIIEANKYNLIMLLNEKYGNHRHLTVQQLKRFAYCFHVDSFSLKQVDAYPITLRLQSFKPMACVWNAFISIFLIACNKVPYFAEFGIRSFSSILVPSFNILTATIV